MSQLQGAIAGNLGALGDSESGAAAFVGPSTYAANTLGYWLAQASDVLSDQGSGLAPVTAQDQAIGQVNDLLASCDLAPSPSQSLGGPLWNPADTPDDILFNPPTKSTNLVGTIAYASNKLYLAWDGILLTQIGSNGRIMSVHAAAGADTDATGVILAFCPSANTIRPYRSGFLAAAQTFADGDRVKIMAFFDGTNVRWRCKIGSAALVEVTVASTGNFNAERVRIGQGSGGSEFANKKLIKAYGGFDYTLTMADNMDAWWLAN